jgi:hypothetical protein
MLCAKCVNSNLICECYCYDTEEFLADDDKPIVARNFVDGTTTNYIWKDRRWIRVVDVYGGEYV